MSKFLIKSGLMFLFTILANFIGSIKNEPLRIYAQKTFDDFETLIYALLKIDVTSETAAAAFWIKQGVDSISSGLSRELTAVESHPEVEKLLTYIDNKTQKARGLGL